MPMTLLTTTARGAAAGLALAAFAALPAVAQTGASADGETAEAASVNPDDVVATVNGETVTLGELIALRQELPQQYQQLPDEILSRGLVDQLIDQTLLAAAARKAGVDERRDVALSLANQERAILADAMLNARLQEALTEERVREVYEERYADYEGVPEIRARHILVEDEALAEEIRDELEGGADFAELAAEHGTDGTAQRGGDLGFFAEGDMVPAFSEAAFALEEGEIGGPVESSFGFHLIEVTGKRMRPKPAFEEVAQQIAGELSQEIQAEYLDELREEAEIEVTEPPLPASAIRADALIAPGE